MRNESTGKLYGWLLHWGEHLPPDQHYTFSETSDSKKLNLGLMYLIVDLKEGIKQYLNDLENNLLLQSKYEKAQSELASYTFKVEPK